MDRFPRVGLPGVTRDEAEALTNQLNAGRYFTFRYSRAMIALGKHVYRNTVTGNERKARRATGKRQRTGRRATR